MDLVFTSGNTDWCGEKKQTNKKLLSIRANGELKESVARKTNSYWKLPKILPEINAGLGEEPSN